MFPRISSVRHIQDYRLEITFVDGVRAEMDFRGKVVGRGGVFTALEEVDFFRRVAAEPEGGTLVWPNDIDLDPDVLYSEATCMPLPKAAVPS